ncbi:MAG: hypothetical protein IPN07_05300 [Dehalococcoidia bacterium]|nr:hypothetical protein [Dehalococcoidia bacterium]
MTDPTRILIFGQSNTGGVQLADRQAAWPNLVASALPELTGQPVEITVRPFFAHAPGSEDYLERELRRREPDIVFVTLSSFSFLNPVIEPGVRERFGERMGNVYHAFATRLDELTRDRGRLAVTLNRSGRAVARRVFGAAPVTTYEVAVEGTTKALQLLARQEDIQVVAVHGFVKLENRRSGPPSQKEVVLLRFLDEMRTLTGRLRITFINLQEGSVPDTRFLPDGLHVSAAPAPGRAGGAGNRSRTGAVVACGVASNPRGRTGEGEQRKRRTTPALSSAAAAGELQLGGGREDSSQRFGG